jgi:Ca2+-binding EF-hand superfamily protein
MKEFCDWDNDGCISFEEVSGEMTDSIINAIENNINNGLNVSENIEKLTEMEYQVLNENIIEDDTNIPLSDVEKKLPPDLIQYIHDSFDTYDINKNGSINRTEFWQLINSMNLGLTDGDFESIREQWDHNNDGEIDWKEASIQFNNILIKLAADHRDHWV